MQLTKIQTIEFITGITEAQNMQNTPAEESDDEWRANREAADQSSMDKCDLLSLPESLDPVEDADSDVVFGSSDKPHCEVGNEVCSRYRGVSPNPSFDPLPFNPSLGEGGLFASSADQSTDVISAT